jgi:hypothetical protein
VFKALATGFDCVAARPVLLLPPIALDLLLWLGPHLKLPAFVDQLALDVTATMGVAPAGGEQVESLGGLVLERLLRVNLLGLLTSLPVGMPSLITRRMTVDTPWGAAPSLRAPDGLTILLIWGALIVLGQGLGSQFHLWIARQINSTAHLAGVLSAWGRTTLLALMIYGLLAFLGVLSLPLGAVMGSIPPLLGLILAFLAFSTFFWGFVYLMFTPHGIIRYRLGLLRAMKESATVVRLNLLPAVGFLGVSFAIAWLTDQVWSLPGEGTWYLALAILGHALVSATVLAGSYAFYQGRRDWLIKVREAWAAEFKRREEEARKDLTSLNG